MNNIVNKDCLTFKDIEKEIFIYVCQIAVDFTKEFLTVMKQYSLAYSTIKKLYTDNTKTLVPEMTGVFLW